MQMATAIETDDGGMIVKRVAVPVGLEELMDGLTREVIMKQPKDIYVFASQYFAHLLDLRDSGNFKGFPVKRTQSVTKPLLTDNTSNLHKTNNHRTRSVDPSRNLTRQSSIQPESPKRLITVRRFAAPIAEGHRSEKTRVILNKRKARRLSVEPPAPEATPKPSTIPSVKKVSTRSNRDRSTSSTRSLKSNEEKTRTPRQGAKSEKGAPASVRRSELKTGRERREKDSIKDEPKKKGAKSAPIEEGGVPKARSKGDESSRSGEKDGKKFKATNDVAKVEDNDEVEEGAVDGKANLKKDAVEEVCIKEVHEEHPKCKGCSMKKTGAVDLIASHLPPESLPVEDCTESSVTEESKASGSEQIDDDTKLEELNKPKTESNEETVVEEAVDGDTITVENSSVVRGVEVEGKNKLDSIDQPEAESKDSKDDVEDQTKNKQKNVPETTLSSSESEDTYQKESRESNEAKEQDLVHDEVKEGDTEEKSEGLTEGEGGGKDSEAGNKIPELLKTQENLPLQGPVSGKNLIQTVESVMESSEEEISKEGQVQIVDDDIKNGSGQSISQSKISMDQKLSAEKDRDVQERVVGKEILAMEHRIRTAAEEAKENIKLGRRLSEDDKGITENIAVSQADSKNEDIGKEKKEPTIEGSANLPSSDVLHKESIEEAKEIEKQIITMDDDLKRNQDLDESEDIKHGTSDKTIKEGRIEKLDDRENEGLQELSKENVKDGTEATENDKSHGHSPQEENSKETKTEQIIDSSKSDKRLNKDDHSVIGAIDMQNQILQLEGMKDKPQKEILNPGDIREQEELASTEEEVTEEITGEKNVEKVSSEISKNIEDDYIQKKAEELEEGKMIEEAKQDQATGGNKKNAESKIHEKTIQQNESNIARNTSVDEKKEAYEKDVIPIKDDGKEKEIEEVRERSKVEEPHATDTDKKTIFKHDNADKVQDSKSDDTTEEGNKPEDHEQSKAISRVDTGKVVKGIESNTGIIVSPKMVEIDGKEKKTGKEDHEPGGDIAKADEEKETKFEESSSATSNKVEEQSEKVISEENKPSTDESKLENEITDDRNKTGEDLMKTKEEIEEEETGNISKQQDESDRDKKEDKVTDSKLIPNGALITSDSAEQPIAAAKAATEGLKKTETKPTFNGILPKADGTNENNITSRLSKSREHAKTQNRRTKSLSQEHITPKNEEKSKRQKSVDLHKNEPSSATKAKPSKPPRPTPRTLSLDSPVTKSAAAATKIETQKSFDSSKLRQELKHVEENSKASAFKTSFNPFVLRQELKKASASEEEDLTKFHRVSKRLSAAVKIQAVWRGFSVRKLLRKRSAKPSAKAREVKKKLQEELKAVEEISKTTSFKTGYNPFVLRQEIKKASGESGDEESGSKMGLIASPVAAALKIQSCWRGFVVRKQRKTKSKVNEETGEPVLEKSFKLEHLADAALVIQKGWRGFKVRKLKKRGDVFGSTVSIRVTPAEELKEVVKKKHRSALKIQSLWRGYKVRKGIKEVDRKLSLIEEEGDGRPGGRKIPSDEDIMNAASKIQAGVRGYMVRKKHNKNNLKSIAEEDKPSDEDIVKALENLENVPDHTPTHPVPSPRNRLKRGSSASEKNRRPNRENLKKSLSVTSLKSRPERIKHNSIDEAHDSNELNHDDNDDVFINNLNEARPMTEIELELKRTLEQIARNNNGEEVPNKNLTRTSGESVDGSINQVAINGSLSAGDLEAKQSTADGSPQIRAETNGPTANRLSDETSALSSVNKGVLVPGSETESSSKPSAVHNTLEIAQENKLSGKGQLPEEEDESSKRPKSMESNTSLDSVVTVIYNGEDEAHQINNGRKTPPEDAEDHFKENAKSGSVPSSSDITEVHQELKKLLDVPKEFEAINETKGEKTESMEMENSQMITDPTSTSIQREVLKKENSANIKTKSVPTSSVERKSTELEEHAKPTASVESEVSSEEGFKTDSVFVQQETESQTSVAEGCVGDDHKLESNKVQEPLSEESLDSSGNAQNRLVENKAGNEGLSKYKDTKSELDQVSAAPELAKKSSKNGALKEISHISPSAPNEKEQSPKTVSVKTPKDTERKRVAVENAVHRLTKTQEKTLEEDTDSEDALKSAALKVDEESTKDSDLEKASQRKTSASIVEKQTPNAVVVKTSEDKEARETAITEDSVNRLPESQEKIPKEESDGKGDAGSSTAENFSSISKISKTASEYARTKRSASPEASGPGLQKTEENKNQASYDPSKLRQEIEQVKAFLMAEGSSPRYTSDQERKELTEANLVQEEEYLTESAPKDDLSKHGLVKENVQINEESTSVREENESQEISKGEEVFKQKSSSELQKGTERKDSDFAKEIEKPQGGQPAAERHEDKLEAEEGSPIKEKIKEDQGDSKEKPEGNTTSESTKASIDKNSPLVGKNDSTEDQPKEKPSAKKRLSEDLQLSALRQDSGEDSDTQRVTAALKKASSIENSAEEYTAKGHEVRTPLVRQNTEEGLEALQNWAQGESSSESKELSLTNESGQTQKEEEAAEISQLSKKAPSMETETRELTGKGIGVEEGIETHEEASKDENSTQVTVETKRLPGEGKNVDLISRQSDAEEIKHKSEDTPAPKFDLAKLREEILSVSQAEEPRPPEVDKITKQFQESDGNDRIEDQRDSGTTPTVSPKPSDITDIRSEELKGTTKSHNKADMKKGVSEENSKSVKEEIFQSKDTSESNRNIAESKSIVETEEMTSKKNSSFNGELDGKPTTEGVKYVEKVAKTQETEAEVEGPHTASSTDEEHLQKSKLIGFTEPKSQNIIQSGETGDSPQDTSSVFKSSNITEGTKAEEEKEAPEDPNNHVNAMSAISKTVATVQESTQLDRPKSYFDQKDTKGKGNTHIVESSKDKTEDDTTPSKEDSKNEEDNNKAIGNATGHGLSVEDNREIGKKEVAFKEESTGPVQKTTSSRTSSSRRPSIDRGTKSKSADKTPEAVKGQSARTEARKNSSRRPSKSLESAEGAASRQNSATLQNAKTERRKSSSKRNSIDKGSIGSESEEGRSVSDKRGDTKKPTTSRNSSPDKTKRDVEQYGTIRRNGRSGAKKLSSKERSNSKEEKVEEGSPKESGSTNEIGSGKEGQVKENFPGKKASVEGDGKQEEGGNIKTERRISGKVNEDTSGNHETAGMEETNNSPKDGGVDKEVTDDKTAVQASEHVGNAGKTAVGSEIKDHAKGIAQEKNILVEGNKGQEETSVVSKEGTESQSGGIAKQDLDRTGREGGIENSSTESISGKDVKNRTEEQSGKYIDNSKGTEVGEKHVGRLKNKDSTDKSDSDAQAVAVQNTAFQEITQADEATSSKDQISTGIESGIKRGQDQSKPISTEAVEGESNETLSRTEEVKSENVAGTTTHLVAELATVKSLDQLKDNADIARKPSNNFEASALSREIKEAQEITKISLGGSRSKSSEASTEGKHQAEEGIQDAIEKQPELGVGVDAERKKVTGNLHAAADGGGGNKQEIEKEIAAESQATAEKVVVEKNTKIVTQNQEGQVEETEEEVYPRELSVINEEDSEVKSAATTPTAQADILKELVSKSEDSKINKVDLPIQEPAKDSLLGSTTNGESQETERNMETVARQQANQSEVSEKSREAQPNQPEEIRPKTNDEGGVVLLNIALSTSPPKSVDRRSPNGNSRTDCEKGQADVDQRIHHRSNVQTLSTTTVNLVHTGEFHDTVTVPLPVTPPSKDEPTGTPSPTNNSSSGHAELRVLSPGDPSEASPAGAPVLTSDDDVVADGQSESAAVEVVEVVAAAQASSEDAAPAPKTTSCGAAIATMPSSTVMEQPEKRNNASSKPKKNMEAEAATKIQAGFRGYQVRKQLKSKTGSGGDGSNQRRSARRKSSGRITESGRIAKAKNMTDLEEKSAVKIQAGVRGFLVRRRQQKTKGQSKESS